MKSPAFRRRKIVTFVKKAIQSYKSGSHTRYDIKYHIVWITKYRKPIMVGPLAERLRELICQICQQNEVTIIKGHIIVMSIIKEGFGCSDEDLFEKCQFDLLVRKALGLFSLSDVVPSIDTYYLLRRRICEYENRHGVNLMEKSFEQLTGDQLFRFKVSRPKAFKTTMTQMPIIGKKETKR